MASLLKKYQSLTREQVPFKIMSEMERLIMKQKSRYNAFIPNPMAYKSHIKYFTNGIPSNNVPVIVGSKEEMYDEMRKAIGDMTGTNFVLGMQTDEGQLQVWRRPSQPCQGGEMRKYGITHDDSTRPMDPRPTDLRYPFPDGKPLAVGSRIRNKLNSHLTIDPESPYRRAYGDEKNVEIVNTSAGDGFLMLDADLVEPTALVHLLRDSRYRVTDYGLPPVANFLFNQLSSTMSYLTFTSSIQEDNGGSSYINLKKISKGGIEASADLSGGTLGNRFDYNRPDIDSMWRDPSGNNFSIRRFVNEVFFDNKPSSKSIEINQSTAKRYAGAIEQYLKEV
jgi:hypothetical protein